MYVPCEDVARPVEEAGIKRSQGTYLDVHWQNCTSILSYCSSFFQNYNISKTIQKRILHYPSIGLLFVYKMSKFFLIAYKKKQTDDVIMQKFTVELLRTGCKPPYAWESHRHHVAVVNKR